MTNFHCKKCGALIATKRDNTLTFKNTLLTLFDCELLIPCENELNGGRVCDYTLRFRYKRARRCRQRLILPPVENYA